MGLINGSNELNTMIRNKEGYRNEMFRYDSSIKNVKHLLEPVLEFEIFELGNEDVFDSMKILYSDNIFSKYEPPLEDDLSLLFEYTVDYIAKVLKCYRNELRCVWLTTYQGAKYLYCDDADAIELRKYSITDKMMPISDLGIDGVLFAYAEIDTPNYMVEEGDYYER